MIERRPVVGYEGLYDVSSTGEVRKLLAGGPVVLNQTIKGHFYFRVSLTKDKASRQTPVHRIIATAFIPNPLRKTQVNHIDGCKTNNDLSNLEWSTPAENTLHSYRVIGNKQPIGEKNRISVEYLIELPDGEKVQIKGINSFCRQMNLDPHSMHRTILDGRAHRGYRMLERLTKDTRLPNGRMKAKHSETGATT